ncbi:MAG: PepSY domain-containing protein [Phenylobacterium sp.]|nr:PepSY domain-containing protein [Phenylobacterium sp.]
MRPTLLAASIVALATVAGAAQADDRDPTPAERTQIEAKLRAEGFVRWDDIELEDDNGLWEVDDAKMPDGRKFDLRLKPGTLEVVSRRADD